MAEPSLQECHAMLVALCAHLGVPGHGRSPAASNGVSRGPTGEVAPDRDLDGERGNPAIRKDPSRWTGESFIGCNYADCPPEYLDILADSLDWQADRRDEEGLAGKVRTHNGKTYPVDGKLARMDAARARGWAQRKRNGWSPPPAPGDSDFGYGGSTGGGSPPAEDDIPF